MVIQKKGRIKCNMNRVEQHLADKLKQRETAGNLRLLRSDRAAVDFFSNDYLGFASTGLLASLMHPMQQSGTGSTGSRLLSGNSREAEELERTIAAFHNAEAALLFNSGYDANLGLLSAIADRHTTLIYDELCHASIIDGVRLSLCGGKYKFAHNDINALEALLKKGKDGPVIVIVESVYSMDGDIAPLKELVALCEKNNAQLIVDEAHATGVVGTKGEGAVCALGLQDRVFARVHTFGKALGCHGAAVVGSSVLKQYLVNFARSFIYTTALPGHSLHAVHCAYQHMASHSFSNKDLHELIAYFKAQVKGMPGWTESHSPIQAYVVGDSERCRKLAAQLQHAGLQVNPILHPTVAAGGERLRVCLHSYNTKEHVDKLVSILKN
jgi:8-amino-7-oxononanoate synthase